MITANEILFSRHVEEKFIFSKLTRLLCSELPFERDIIFLCIGIDRSSGDSFGPLTGSFLKQKNTANVFGTLEEPVHAKNLLEIYNTFPKNCYIVAIDASLGRAKEVGVLTVKRGPLYPGRAMKRELPPVGDMSVILNVNVGGIANYLCLQTASLNTVWKGACVLSRAIFTAFHMDKSKINSMRNVEPAR